MNGNPGAQETVYNKYRKIVKDYILGKYGTYYDIDDDVSEIMIKVFLNLESFDSTKAKFKSWVITISKNYIIDKWRSRGTVTFTLTDNPNYSLTSCDYSNSCYSGNLVTTNSVGITNADCNSTSCTFENCNTINYISTQLSPSDYTLLDMKYVQGYNYNEIGSEFQVTSSTVSNRINYIKTKLKKKFPENIFD